MEKKPSKRKISPKIIIAIIFGIVVLGTIVTLALISFGKKRVEKTESSGGLVVSEPSSSPSLSPEIQAVVASYEQIPETATLKTTLHGIPIYETEERKLTDGEISILKQILDGIPQEILNIKPKVIIATTREAQKSMTLQLVKLRVDFIYKPGYLLL